MGDDPFPGLFARQRQAALDVGETVRAAVARMSAQLEHERQRADQAEKQIEHERVRADRAEARADRADQRLDGERIRSADALTAERIARDEAAGLRAELEAHRQRGLRCRLRWALSRRR
jgi:hypothetical protein